MSRRDAGALQRVVSVDCNRFQRELKVERIEMREGLKEVCLESFRAGHMFQGLIAEC